MAETFDINTLFNDYRQKIYRLALGITRNEKDAEDILQNTFLKVIQHLGEFRQRSRISTWMYRIAYNEALMLLRKKKRLLNFAEPVGDLSFQVPSGWSVNWPEIPDAQLLNKELKARLERGLKTLPIKYRMPLLLHRVEGISLQETAAILNLKLNSLKTRLHRAGLMIKAEMDLYHRDRKQVEPLEHTCCPVFTGVINEYVQKTMAPAETKRFDAHIKDCDGCHAFLHSYERALQITNALQCQDIPRDFQVRLEAFLKLRGHTCLPAA